MPDPFKPRGILIRKAGLEKEGVLRQLPSPDLSLFVEHFWGVRWDLRNQPPFVQQTLPHPSLHLVVEENSEETRFEVFGTITGKFIRTLKGKGEVFGVKFRPGSFYPFLQRPVIEVTDTIFDPASVFGPEANSFAASILGTAEFGQRVALAEEFLRARLPPPDENLSLIHTIVQRIAEDRDITKVDHITAAYAINKRTLQRLFSTYVGVTPKWIIQRYRLHEAAEQLAEGCILDWPQLALDLGYFDQSHFIRDFKAIVGKSPAEYVRESAANRQSSTVPSASDVSGEINAHRRPHTA